MVTPDNGLEEPLFAVMRGDGLAAYMGPHCKCPSAIGSDYASMKSGASLVRTVGQHSPVVR